MDERVVDSSSFIGSFGTVTKIPPRIYSGVKESIALARAEEFVERSSTSLFSLVHRMLRFSPLCEPHQTIVRANCRIKLALEMEWRF